MMRDRGHGVKTRMAQSRFQVRVPYHPDFVLAAHKLGANYKRRSGIWSFDRSHYFELAKVLNQLYGTDLPEEP